MKSREAAFETNKRPSSKRLNPNLMAAMVDSAEDADPAPAAKTAGQSPCRSLPGGSFREFEKK